MASEELKKRLSQLERTRAGRHRASPVRPPAPQAAEDLRVISVPELPDDLGQPDRPRIEQIAPGRVVEVGGGGVYWLVERRLSEIDLACAPFVTRYGDLLTSEAILLPEGTSRWLAAFVECNPRRVLYLDIETTGLSAQPLFLIGTMEFDGSDFVIKQFFARNYAEERHLLTDLAGHVTAFDLLVTYNGKSFDIPYIRDRAATNRLRVEWPATHLDLLHESRRRWRGLLPNCKLTTVEQYICRRRRVDDIPGAEIPAAYHEFVHTENATKMRHVLHHNALDLVTMAEIALFMLVGRNDWT